jgi:hypothetical protein
MDCSVCKKPAISLNYLHATRAWACKECYEAPPPMYDPKVQVTITDGLHSVTMSTGHLKDIQARHVEPDGSVTRRNGRRTYFTK